MKASGRIAAIMDVLTELYSKDFPVVVAPSPSQAIVEHKDASGESLTVVLDDSIRSESEYKVLLSKWQQSVEELQAAARADYIGARLQWVVDEGDDAAKLSRKVEAFAYRRQSAERQELYAPVKERTCPHC